jgi:hypothetical protein
MRGRRIRDRTDTATIGATRRPKKEQRELPLMFRTESRLTAAQRSAFHSGAELEAQARGTRRAMPRFAAGPEPVKPGSATE